MRRKINRIILAGICLSCVALKGETLRVTGFEDKDNVKFNSAMNCKHEVILKGENEKIPEGEKYIKVTMGGLNNKKGGALSVILPKDKIPDNANKISIWIKGDTANTFGPVLMLGDWCWMGKRYEAKSQIPVNDNEWVKYEFKLSDFVPALTREPKNIKQINKYDCLYIDLGEAKDYPESIVFYLDNIEISNDK